MKRSNRLILLIGVFLAIVAFIGVVALFQTPPSGPSTAGSETQVDVVYANVDIPLGTILRADMLTEQKVAAASAAADAVKDIGLAVGRQIRTEVVKGAQIRESMFTGTAAPQITQVLPEGLRAVSVQVDQVSGVGALIQVGDRVDLLVGFQGADKFPVITIDPETDQITPVPGLNNTTVKLLLQNLQVVGTLLPPQPQQQQQTQEGQQAQPQPALTGASEIVILAVTPQQAEVIKFAQLDGSISLVLRSPKDFVDENNQPVTPVADPTSGIILKTLVDEYGVLVPQLVETILPAGRT
ncbi:MAG TPA: Flp pilus assembly protein CpaB [Candidatus Limnocylindrales bacterium]|nr:Flp pilus assembly protein CpaB [Candidatus Limnocylindrales bacterium]